MKGKRSNPVGRGFSTILSGLILLALMTNTSMIASAQLIEDFEGGFADWTKDWNFDPAYFDISISSLYAFSGSVSVKIGIHGLPGQFLTGWIERTLPVPPSTVLTVGVTFQLYSEAPADTPREVLAYIGNADPSLYTQFTLMGMTEQVTGGWFEYSYQNTFTTSPTGNIFVAVGWHNDITGFKSYYIDWVDISGISIDDTPPDITNMTPVNQTTIADNQPTVGADYWDDSGVSVPSVVLEVDGANVTSFSSVTGADVNYVPPTQLPEGVHNVYLEASDLSTSKNKAVRTWWFTVDTLPPIITNEQPTNLSSIGNDLPTISASYSDATSGIDSGSVLLKVDSVNVTSSATITSSDVSFLPLAALPDGPHNVYLEVSDNSVPRNKAVKTWSFTVDTTPPQITNLVPTDGSMINSDQPTISASYSDTSGIDISSVRLKVDTFDVTPLSTVTSSDVLYIPSPLFDGVHNVHLYVEDVFSSSAEAFWSFTVDATPPITTLNILTPQYTSTKTFITSATPLNLTWDDGTGLGVTDVSYLFYAFGETEPGYSSYSSDFTIPNTKSDGLIYVKYKSLDALGNEETEHVSEVYLDNTPPTTSIAIGGPNHTASGSTFVTSSTPFTLKATDGSGSGFSSIEYCIKKGGSFEVPWTLYVGGIYLSGVDGDRQILFRSTDNLGNMESDITLDVYLDDTGPTTGAVFGDPKHSDSGITYVNSNTAISLTQDDGAGSGTATTIYRIMKGGAPEIQWTDYTGADFFLSGTVDGLREIVFRSTDNLGNEETQGSVQVYLDTTAPTSSVPGYDAMGTNIINNTLSTITIDATDGDGSGVNAIKYGIDDPNCPTTYMGPIVAGSMVEGPHTLHFKSLDNVGNEEAIKSISLILDLTSPIADAGDDVGTNEGGLVAFDGGGSDDGSTGSGINEYTWTFIQDGSTVPLDGKNPTYTFRKEGTYVVTLTVTDNAGNENTDTVTVTVAKSAAAEDTWWILVLLAMLVVSMVLLFALFKKKKKKPEDEEERECEDCGRILGPHDRICPECDSVVAGAARK